MGKPVVHFEVVGKDSAALQRFCAAAFGWEMKPASRATRWRTLAARTASTAALAPRRMAGGGHVTFYIEVDDLPAALTSVEKLGGKRGWGQWTSRVARAS